MGDFQGEKVRLLLLFSAPRYHLLTVGTSMQIIPKQCARSSLCLSTSRRAIDHAEQRIKGTSRGTKLASRMEVQALSLRLSSGTSQLIELSGVFSRRPHQGVDYRSSDSGCERVRRRSVGDPGLSLSSSSRFAGHNLTDYVACRFGAEALKGWSSRVRGPASAPPARARSDPRSTLADQVQLKARPAPFVHILFSTSASPRALTTCWCFTVQVMRHSKYSPAMLDKQFVTLLMHGGVSMNIFETIFNVAIVDAKRISSCPQSLRGR